MIIIMNPRYYIAKTKKNSAFNDLEKGYKRRMLKKGSQQCHVGVT